MKRPIAIALCLLVALIASPVHRAVAASDFAVSPLTPDDKAKITKALKPLETKWVPAEELAKYPGVYWQDDWQKQSFHIKSTQAGLEDVYFVPIAADYERGLKSDKSWNESVSLLILNAADLSIRALPAHPAMDSAVYDVAAVAFRDIRGDGTRAIIVDARAIAGAGANAADPVDMFAIYFPKNGEWALDKEVQKRIERAKTLDQATKAAKAYFAPK